MPRTPRAAEGGSVAADDLVRTWHDAHSSFLHGWARSRLPDHDTAEEVVAETLVRAWRHADSYDPARGSERAWLLGICRRVLADHHRATARRGLRVVSFAPPDRPEEDAELARVVQRSYVTDALATLSQPHRTALVEAYYEGRTTREIARRHDIPAGTVKSRLYHALRALRSELADGEVLP